MQQIRKAIVKLPLGVWRDGKPRFVPGPNLRALGYKGRDLKHPNGSWFTLAEAESELTRIQAEAQARKHGKAAGHLATPVATPTLGRTLSQLCDDLFSRPEFQGKPLVDGKKLRQPLSPVTVAGYQKYARLVQQACARLDRDDTWHMPAPLIGPARMQALLNEIERHSGLQQARKARGFLSTLWSKQATREPGVLKGLFLELEAMPMPEGRIRPAEPHEFWAMVEAAERLGRFDMADSFFWAVLHGDRQTDRLNPTVLARSASHITLKHSKTGLTTTKLLDPWLQSRFAAAALRRKALKVQWPQLTIDEQAGRPWHPSGNHYAHVFTAIRREAAKAVPSLLNGPNGHKGLRDQDWRDTNQTWLDRASVDPATMALIAGHSLGSAQTAMQKRHYVAANQQRMDAAVMAISALLTNTAPASMKEAAQ